MRSASIFLFAVLIAGPASADDQTWEFASFGEGDARLVYGVPNSESYTLGLVCNSKSRRLSIASTVLPPKAKVGNRTTIRFASGAASLQYKCKTVRKDDENTFYVEVLTTADSRLFNLLKAGSTLSIEAGATKKDIPLGGIGAPLAQMERACLGTR